MTYSKISALPNAPELIAICRTICESARSDSEWSAIESDDQFQSLHFCGGYDATERAFCFGMYGETGEEVWFQVTLTDVAAIARGDSVAIELRSPC